MHACLQQQDDDENQVLQEDEEGAKDRTHDLAKVVLDLQEKVALMSKELKEYKKETDQKQKKTEEEQQKKTEEQQKKTEEQQKKTEEQQRKTKYYVEEQVALISRNIEKSEEDVEDPIAPISDNPKTRGIDEDTFSIMMTSKVRSIGWVLGLGTFAFQMILTIIILIGYFRLSKGSTPFDAPIRVNNEVRAGQFSAVILSLLSQQDILTAIDSLIAFRSSSPANKDSGFYRLLVDDNDADELKKGGQRKQECATWLVRAILPNCLKLIQGISVLFVALIMIIKSDDLIALLRDFSALYYLSEIDNIVFKVASQGYFGENLKARTEKVKHVVKYVEVNNMEDVTTTTTSCCVVERFKRQLKMFVLFALALTMFSGLICVTIGQISGDFLRMKYPNCRRAYPFMIGDGKCHNYDPYNTEACGYDGGDCVAFNNNYPNCTAELIWMIGDGKCHNYDPYNTEACGYDGGDCVAFNKYPNCTAGYYAYMIGDGICHNSGPFNTEACGYDGGDCRPRRQSDYD